MSLAGSLGLPAVAGFPIRATIVKLSTDPGLHLRESLGVSGA